MRQAHIAARQLIRQSVDALLRSIPSLLKISISVKTFVVHSEKILENRKKAGLTHYEPQGIPSFDIINYRFILRLDQSSGSCVVRYVRSRATYQSRGLTSLDQDVRGLRKCTADKRKERVLYICLCEGNPLPLPHGTVSRT